MKRTSLIVSVLLALGVAFAATGCSTFSPSAKAAPKGPAVYAVVVSVSGGQVPTDAQWATIQKKFAALLSARGIPFVTDPTFADKLIQVMFIPDPDDPTTGTSYVVGILNNPGNPAEAFQQNLPSLGYGYAGSLGLGSFGYGYGYGFQPQYYGYYTDYTDYSGNIGGGVVSPPTTGVHPSRPPGHGGDHHTTRPIDCPPDTSHRPPSGYAGTHPSRPDPSDGGHHWWNPRSDSGSSSSSSSSYSSSSSSNYVGPTTSYSSSSSYSAPSISFSSSPSSSSSYSSPVDTGPSSSSSSSSSSGNTISFPSRP